jgi:uncharacterized membrane protein
MDFLVVLNLIGFNPLLAQTAAKMVPICNNTDQVVRVASGYELLGVWHTAGWERINPKKCLDYFESSTEKTVVYLYASAMDYKWPGKKLLCLHDNRRIQSTRDYANKAELCKDGKKSVSMYPFRKWEIQNGQPINLNP